MERLRIVVMILACGVASASAQTDAGALPTYDIAKTCHDQASYAFAATLGQVDLDREVDICATRERASRDLAATAWPRAAARTRTECVGLAEGRYTRLATCLEDSRARR